jgi:hypothetical protein
MRRDGDAAPYHRPVGRGLRTRRAQSGKISLLYLLLRKLSIAARISPSARPI